MIRCGAVHLGATGKAQAGRLDALRGFGIAVGGDCDISVGPCGYDLEIANNTFVGNAGPGVSRGPDSSPGLGKVSVINNIFVGCDDYAIDDWAPLVEIGGNDFFANTPAAWAVGTNAAPDNSFVDPLFVDAANGDYHLAVGSPSIDRGRNLSVVTDDRDGTFRPLDGDGDGFAFHDQGAYEHAGPLSAFDLRRADFTSLTPPTPDMALVFPFDAANPLTSVVKAHFTDGDADPTAWGAPLALYQVTPDPQRVLLVVKGNGYRFHLR